jgi:hypothetical protein
MIENWYEYMTPEGHSASGMAHENDEVMDILEFVTRGGRRSVLIVNIGSIDEVAIFPMLRNTQCSD